MARKVVDAPKPVEPPPVAGAVEIPPPSFDEAPKRKRGRPSKAELEARRMAEAQAARIEPKDMLGVTAGLLGITAGIIKGDDPTPDELSAVNNALTAVCNKYGTSFRYWEEALLLLSFGTAAVGMKQRARERERMEAKIRAEMAGTPPTEPEFDFVLPPDYEGKVGDS